MRIAVIGYGSIGRRHAQNLRALGHAAVVIDVAETARQQAIQDGWSAHRTLSMHCGPLDAAIIATPAETHLTWLRECVAWGLPVLVEKPLGRVEDRDELRALHPIKPVMVGYNLRFHPEIRRIQPTLSPAAAGILQCECDSRTWPGSAARGDMFGEFSHEIDLALHCGASPRVVVTVRTEHRARLMLGSYHINLADRDAYLRRWRFFDQPRGSYDVTVESPRDLAQTYVDELAHFLRAVEGGTIAPGCTLEEGLAVLDVIAYAKGAV